MEKEILDEILKCIYWRTFTPSQTKTISDIIKADDTNTEKANVICEYLGIEKRGNRSAIIEVLSKNNL